MLSIKRSHALIAALSLLLTAVVAKEVYASIVTTSASKKVLRRFILRNVDDFFTTIELSPGVPYIVPTKKRFIITDITVCNVDDDLDAHMVLLADPNFPTVTLNSDLCVKFGDNVHVNYTIGPQVLAGQGISVGNSEGPNAPLNVYVAGYEEKG